MWSGLISTVSVTKHFICLGQADQIVWIEKIVSSMNLENFSIIQELQSIPLICSKFKMSCSYWSETPLNTP